MLFSDKELNNLRAEFFESYIAFDDNFSYAVLILDEKDKETDMKVFRTKDEALLFEKEYNEK